MAVTPKPWDQRFDVDATTGCWVWNCRVETNGYGRVWYQGRNEAAHRLMYEVFVGEIPAGMEIDHLCRNKACVNPSHLEAVSRAENQRRGHSVRLDWGAARLIRSTYVPRHPQYGVRALARRFCVSPQAVSKIVQNKAWIEDPALAGGN